MLVCLAGSYTSLHGVSLGFRVMDGDLAVGKDDNLTESTKGFEQLIANASSEGSMQQKGPDN